MERLEFNVTTGEQQVIKYTQDEIAAIEAAAAAIPRYVPQEVTRFQARAALYQAGWLDDVEALIAAPETDRMLVLAWQDAQAFKRTSQFVLGMAQQLNMTDQQLDDLFIVASQIE